MEKKRFIGWLLAGITGIIFWAHSVAWTADNVVVIPLESSSGDSGGVRTVMSAGQVWMDRNLGARRAAINNNDSQAYGSPYQWGRLGDGHEYRESPTTTTLSPGDVPGHGHFITVNASPYDWTALPNNNLWQGESGINNPCPAGFRLPTQLEWVTERASWSSNDSAGAFASPLKLVVAGLREAVDGMFRGAGSSGYYWSSTVDVSRARYLRFDSGSANMNSGARAFGFSVRCIKD